MVFSFKNERVAKIYWRTFGVICLICFFCHITGITSFICEIIGSPPDDSTLVASIIPICYLIFNSFIGLILDIIFD